MYVSPVGQVILVLPTKNVYIRPYVYLLEAKDVYILPHNDSFLKDLAAKINLLGLRNVLLRLHL